MTDHELRNLLRESAAPEPSAAADARIREAWRAACVPVWRRFLTPIPALAAAALLAVAVWIGSHGLMTKPATRVTSSGFVALPDGAARVVPLSEVER
jgi:hypothetical protein